MFPFQLLRHLLAAYREVWLQVSVMGPPAIGGKTANTNRCEHRFQCQNRLVRATLSFSKKLSNHIGAITYFICDYNLTRCAALPEKHYPYFVTLQGSGYSPTCQSYHCPQKRAGGSPTCARLSFCLHLCDELPCRQYLGEHRGLGNECGAM
jgi:hypothetical protein